MNHQTEIDRAVEAHAAEKAFQAELDAIAERVAEVGRAAFFRKATQRTETEQLLFEARSVLQILNQNDRLGRAEFDERLLDECVWLCGGDKLKGALLASAVLE